MEILVVINLLFIVSGFAYIKGRLDSIEKQEELDEELRQAAIKEFIGGLK